MNDNLRIHHTSSISELSDIEISKKGSLIKIGAHCMIDSFVKIKPAGGEGDIIIGDYCYINSGCVLYSGNGITIGNNVAIASNCTIAPTNHEFSDASNLIMEQGFAASKRGIYIGSDVWIGANCVILDGALINDGCVVGAHSLVRGELEENGVYAGNPIKLLRKRS